MSRVESLELDRLDRLDRPWNLPWEMKQAAIRRQLYPSRNHVGMYSSSEMIQ